MQYCNCYQPLPFKTAARYLKEELIEFLQKPSIDELGDVIRVTNRLAGSIFKKKEIRLIPYPKSHVFKVDNRMKANGCIRSTRHLVNGRCPSIGE